MTISFPFLALTFCFWSFQNAASSYSEET
uniref:Uncharacterized protein n=1 Tax=Rhizophora mucronata TaxID=61149 RepID=A0A2P2J3V8_RHIMU